MANSIILTEKSQEKQHSFYPNNRFIGSFNLSNMVNSDVGDALAALGERYWFDYIIQELRLRSAKHEMHIAISADTEALCVGLEKLSGCIADVTRALGWLTATEYFEQCFDHFDAVTGASPESGYYCPPLTEEEFDFVFLSAEELSHE
jgi:hypothetical protein